MNTKTLIEIIENLSEIDEVTLEELKNIAPSVVDRAIVDAYLLQQEGKVPEAIERWRSIANISQGLDNELASYAWFSIGSLLAKDNQKENALSAYNQSLNPQPKLCYCLQ